MNNLYRIIDCTKRTHAKGRGVRRAPYNPGLTYVEPANGKRYPVARIPSRTPAPRGWTNHPGGAL